MDCSGLLAAAYLVSGGGKLILRKERIAATGASARWVEDFSARSVKAIGALEVLGAMGLILPAALESRRFWCRSLRWVW